MKEWKEYLFKVNGFEMTAVYNEDTIQKVFLPLLKQLQQLQKEITVNIHLSKQHPQIPVLYRKDLSILYTDKLCLFGIFIKTRSRVYRHSSIRIRWISLSL